MSPAVAQPEQLCWSGNAAPPYPAKLTSTQEQDSDDTAVVLAVTPVTDTVTYAVTWQMTWQVLVSATLHIATAWTARK